MPAVNGFKLSKDYKKRYKKNCRKFINKKNGFCIFWEPIIESAKLKNDYDSKSNISGKTKIIT